VDKVRGVINASKIIHKKLNKRRINLPSGTQYSTSAVPNQAESILISFDFLGKRITDEDRTVLHDFCMNGFGHEAKGIMSSETGIRTGVLEVSVRPGRGCYSCLISRKPKNKK